MTTALHLVQATHRLAQQAGEPAAAYLCEWAAFETLYAHLATQSGLRPHFGLRQNGTLRTHKSGATKMPEVYPPTPRAQLERALELAPAALKHRLITHPATEFFVTRVPTWQGRYLPRDARDQPLNGVLDLSMTLDPRYPVWSPIAPATYRAYTEAAPTQAELARQIVELLSTVRRNLTHDDAHPDGENGPRVLQNARALLTFLVGEWCAELTSTAGK